MKKTIICNIPMKENINPSVYLSNDNSLPSSECAVKYPVNAFLSKTITYNDEVKIILLSKKDSFGVSEKNKKAFIEELEQFINGLEIKITYVEIDTDFEESRTVHEQLMGRIVDEIDEESHIIADITYGPKDLPIVLFAALNFVEKFLNCEIDNIIYGKAVFMGDAIVGTELCDMVPLYCLGSITNTIHTVEPGKAKSMLKMLLSL